MHSDIVQSRVFRFFRFIKSINCATRITLARIAMLPLILFFYVMAIDSGVTFFAEWGRFIAVCLFVFAAATDWLDGFIARKYNQTTNTGKLLDPVADKMLVMLGLILILADPIWHMNWTTIADGQVIFSTTSVAFQFWFVATAIFIMLGRDIIMNSLRFIAAEQGITIAADKLGKIKSIFQFIAITLYMSLAFFTNLIIIEAVDYHTIWVDTWAYIAVFTLVTATILSIWSCVNYIQNYARSIKEKTNDTNRED